MDHAQALAAMRKPLTGEVVHYVTKPGICDPGGIVAVEEDDIFLDLDLREAPLGCHVMLDSRFGFWDCDFKSYRRGTWHWPDTCQNHRQGGTE